jgi:hypothetical protein
VVNLKPRSFEPKGNHPWQSLGRLVLLSNGNIYIYNWKDIHGNISLNFMIIKTSCITSAGHSVWIHHWKGHKIHRVSLFNGIFQTVTRHSDVYSTLTKLLHDVYATEQAILWINYHGNYVICKLWLLSDFQGSSSKAFWNDSSCTGFKCHCIFLKHLKFANKVSWRVIPTGAPPVTPLPPPPPAQFYATGFSQLYISRQTAALLKYYLMMFAVQYISPKMTAYVV